MNQKLADILNDKHWASRGPTTEEIAHQMLQKGELSVSTYVELIEKFRSIKRDLNMIHPPEWFYERIGKRVFQIPKPNCKPCETAAKIGILIRSYEHAITLFGKQGLEKQRYTDETIAV